MIRPDTRMTLRLDWVVRLALGLGLLANTAQCQVVRQIQPADIVAIRSVNDVQISSDGKLVAFEATEPIDLHSRSRVSDVWIAPVDGNASAHRLLAKHESRTTPRWSPDGKYLAFISRSTISPGESKQAAQIYLIHAEGGEAHQITYVKGGVQSFKWSPDGTMIAFTARDAEGAAKQLSVPGDDAVEVGHSYRFTRLWLVSLSKRKPELVTQQSFQVNDFEWSPDGSEFALRISQTPTLDDVLWHSRLIIVYRSTGQLVRTMSQHISPWEGTLRWSPDGQTIAFPNFTPAGIASWLTLKPARGGPERYLLKDYHGTLRSEEWTRDSKFLIGEAEVGAHAELLRIDATTGEVTKLAEVLASVSGFSITPDGSTIAYLCEKPNAPSNVCVINADHTSRQLTHFNTQLASVRLGKAQEVTWNSKTDGKRIYGVLITPPSYNPAQRYPAVVIVHGGPLMAWLTGWNDWGQLLASHGYVVLLPNPRGSEGQGWQFAEGNLDDWGGNDFRDIMDGVDSLIARKIADPDRLGIGGWSYGGFMTSWAVTHTNRFKAAIEGAGITDLISFDGTAGISPTFLKTYFLNTPFRNWSVYDTHSPIFSITKCKTPILILHGLEDDVVPVGQSEEFYHGLRLLGSPVELVLYPREGHVFHEPAHQLDVLTRVLAWYDKYLK
jgi:dipeptidyl aminopeptidase/acylaminoacyl peptidase